MVKKVATINIDKFINDWIAASNAFDTKRYLHCYSDDALLDDVSVGSKFKDHTGIKRYFESYFISYNTQTKLVRLHLTGKEKAHLEVEFTGNFSEGKIGGTFDFAFKNGKISFVIADLIH